MKIGSAIATFTQAKGFIDVAISISIGHVAKTYAIIAQFNLNEGNPVSKSNLIQYKYCQDALMYR